MYRFLKVLTLLILFFSCKHTETYEGTSDDEVIVAFDKVRQSSIKRDINYLPRWQDRIEFEGSYYIPLNTDKRIYSFTPDSVKYSLVDKIWLKANKQGDVWSFTKLIVLPNDIQNSRGSGLFIYEDWQTGALSYEGYIEDKLFSPITYKVNLRMTAYGKKAMNNPNIPCQTVPFQVCAGIGGPYESCTTHYETIGNCNDGGGDTGHYGGGGNSGGGNHGGGGGSTPPIIPPDKDDDDADKEIIDSLQGYPCAQAILAKIPNLENKISKWLNDVFKNNTDFKITFRVDANLAGTNEDANHTSSGTIYSQKHIISMNPDILSNSSKEYIAATMFHEALHGFLNFEFARLATENKSEQFGILYSGWLPQNVGSQRKFVKNHATFGTQLDELAAAIQSFNPNMSPYDAMALAKGGVVNIDGVETSVNKSHRSGNAGTLCK
ncbi:hypothetical protein [Sphingobacterium sp.]|uniref:hypothetical protein n=1 Tax=Sphingobacterium sp. TaxID=341027 RepID=UPI002FDA157F